MTWFYIEYRLSVFSVRRYSELGNDFNGFSVRRRTRSSVTISTDCLSIVQLGSDFNVHIVYPVRRRTRSSVVISTDCLSIVELGLAARPSETDLRAGTSILFSEKETKNYF